MLQSFVRSQPFPIAAGLAEAADPIHSLALRAALAATGAPEHRGRLDEGRPCYPFDRESIMARIDRALCVGVRRAADGARRTAHRFGEEVARGTATPYRVELYTRAIGLWTRIAERRRARLERHRAVWLGLRITPAGILALAEIERRQRPRETWLDWSWTVLADRR